MDLVPEYRAVLGVDAVGAGRLPGWHLDELHDAVQRTVRQALSSVAIEGADIVQFDPTGDGALVTVTSRCAGALLDATDLIDELVVDHNRWRKPEMRLRMAVEIGPVAARGLSATKVAAARMLDAKAFKDVFSRCVETGAPDRIATALVLSDGVLDAVVNAGRSRRVRPTDLAPLRVTNKEFDRSAWVRVPGLDAGSLGRLTDGPVVSPEPPTRTSGPVPGSVGPSVVNIASGMTNGVQAGVVNGGISFGPRS